MAHAYTDYLIDALSPWDTVTVKSMFGGFGLYRRGLIFAILDEDTVYFKANDTNRAEYEAAGMAPFTYTAKGGKRVAMSYWQVPAEVLDDADLLQAWAEKAYQAALGASSLRKKSSGQE